MGAEFQFTKLELKDTTPAKAANDLIQQAAYDFGHSGYTGSFAECDGFRMTDEVFETVNEAHDWLTDNAEKWGPMLGVRVGDEIYVGAWCSS